MGAYCAMFDTFEIYLNPRAVDIADCQKSSLKDPTRVIAN